MTPPISRRSALEAAALAVPAVAVGTPTAHAADASPPSPDIDDAPSAEPGTTVPSEQLAHYYRFQEIVEGRRMVYRSGQWRFEGAPVVLDPQGVHPMADDPDTTRLPQGTPQRDASEACDRTYTDILHALQRVFDGHPRELGHAVSQMFRLEKQAHHLANMQHPSGGPTVLGPAFRMLTRADARPSR